MTKKIITQFSLMVISFFGVWFIISQIHFVNEQDIRAFAKENERKLGELLLETITTTNEKIKNEKINAVLDSIKARICRSKTIDCKKITIHLVRNSEINAFALPDNHMVIYTGLIEYAGNAEEVAGIMAHEIGHMEKKHVMKKLVKEIGLEMLFAMVGGDAGFEIARQTASVLSSSAFDRKHEKEADEFAVESLVKGNIDPQHLSNFFFRLSQKNAENEGLEWLSTHPDSKSRAAEIIRKKKDYHYQTDFIITTDWDEVKNMLQRDAEALSDKKDVVDE